jgi:hypothetical protein
MYSLHGIHHNSQISSYLICPQLETFVKASLAIAALAVASGAYAAKRAPIDLKAVYAVHTVESNGKWEDRELLKLCPVTRAGSRGEHIQYAAVAASKDCPK